jgi:hypothetical protein
MSAQQNLRQYRYPIHASEQRSVYVLFEDEHYIARVHLPCKTVVVSRKGALNGGAHCGEKHVSQDWREVRLLGVPDEVRVQILEAWRAREKCP